MSTKGALKAVRAAIDAKQWDVAAEKARDLLKDDAKNYNAYVTETNQDLTLDHWSSQLFSFLQKPVPGSRKR